MSAKKKKAAKPSVKRAGGKVAKAAAKSPTKKVAARKKGAEKAVAKRAVVPKETKAAHSHMHEHAHEHDHEHSDACDHDHDHHHHHHHAHVRSQTLIAVENVAASAAWYTAVLDVESLASEDPRGHDAVYDRLVAGDDLVLQLHAHEPPEDGRARTKRPELGQGVLLWFEVDDFDAAVARAKKIHAHVIEKPHVNESMGHREVWLRDPDGYVVVIASPDGEVADA